MNRRGYTLIERFEVGKNQSTGDENSKTGDGLWEDADGNITYRDLKICGPQFNCAVSEKSLRLFNEKGFYDFFNKYQNVLFNVDKKFIKYMYKKGLYYKDPKDYDNDLIRFDYKKVEKIHIKLSQRIK